MDNVIIGDKEKKAQRWKQYKVGKTALRVWYNDDEYDILKSKSAACSMSIAEYVRRTTLNKKISSTSKIHLANSLSKLGGLQVKLNQQLRDEINRSGSSDVITNLIADHNRLYREICNAVREARNGDTGN